MAINFQVQFLIVLLVQFIAHQQIIVQKLNHPQNYMECLRVLVVRQDLSISVGMEVPSVMALTYVTSVSASTAAFTTAAIPV